MLCGESRPRPKDDDDDDDDDDNDVITVEILDFYEFLPIKIRKAWRRF